MSDDAMAFEQRVARINATLARAGLPTIDDNDPATAEGWERWYAWHPILLQHETTGRLRIVWRRTVTRRRCWDRHAPGTFWVYRLDVIAP
jgi:hypothetical protein